MDQYARLIWSMTADFKLVESDAADVAQMTWLRLLEHIDRIEHPDRVGSWLAATARNECLRSLAARKRVVLGEDDVELGSAVAHEPEIDERLLADERAQAVREALSRLPRRWQRLLEMLMADPPVSYAEISDELGLPIGSIGPTRGRCLAGCACCCRPREPSVSASTQRPPAASTSGNAARTSASRSGTNSSTASGRLAASWAGSATGMSVPGIRRPCLAGEASTTAGSSVAIHVRLAQQRDRPGRGAVAEHRPAGGSLGH